MNYKNKNSKSNKKTYFVLLAFFLLIAMACLAYLKLYREDSVSNSVEVDAETTSTAPTAQDTFTGGDDRTVGESNPNKGQATVEDNQGNIEDTPDESAWTISSAGQITLYSPSKNQILENNNLISGKTTLDNINFRIIDNVSGVISEGSLTIVSGNFSGKVSFSTTASEGRLDIFSTLSDGSETNNIEIPVLFK